MRKLYWFILVLAGLGATGCCGEPKEYHYTLPDAVLDLSPYQRGEVFLLRHSDGPSVSIEVVTSDRSSHTAGNCSNCCATEYLDEVFVMFGSDSTALQASLTLSQGGVEGEAAPSLFSLMLGGSGVFYADVNADGTLRLQNGVAHLDSMTVADRTYHNVFALPNQSSNRATSVPEVIYISPFFGLIKIELYGGAFWELFS